MLENLTAELRQLSEVIGSGRHASGVSATLMQVEGEGVYLPLVFDGQSCGIWFPQICWKHWLTMYLATDDLHFLAEELIVAMADWAVSPLLAILPDLAAHNTKPQSMTLLSQWGVTLAFELEEQPFKATLIGWPHRALAETLSAWQSDHWQCDPSLEQVTLWQASLAAGWCRLSIGQLQQIGPGDGLKVAAPAALAQGNCWLWQMGSPQIYIKLDEGNKMTIQQVNEDIDRLLALDTAVAPLAPQSLELDTLPQTLVMEIGRISLPLGDIKQIAVGQTLDCQASFYGEVCIRLNGQPVGSGSLLACGGELVVRVAQWHLTLHP